MRKLWLAASFLLGLCSLALAQSALLTNLPPSTVVGRLGSSQNGAAQAIPFATLLAQLNGLSVIISGPATTTVGDMVLWNSIAGTAIKDSGIAVTGSGTISLTAGKTITDTSAVGANLLLGATGGGFAAYGGTSACASGTAINVLSAAGAATCVGARANSQKQVSAPTAPNSTSAFKMQGLAGSITPTATGNVLIIISGYLNAPTQSGGNGISYQISYGTGSAPTTNAALAGTQVGSVQSFIQPASGYTSTTAITPFSVQAVVTGLTLSTAYWVDLAAESVATASSYGLSNVSISVVEL